MTQELTLPECICKRCGHKWIPRIPEPKICPNRNCHSVYWNVPRKEKGNGKQGDAND